MDPFDELARLSAPGASSRQTSQQGHSEPRQLPSASEPASQLAPNMSALPAAVRGNPFLDTPPKGITAPARARAVPNGAFQVLPCRHPPQPALTEPSRASHRSLFTAGLAANRLFWSEPKQCIPNAIGCCNVADCICSSSSGQQ